MSFSEENKRLWRVVLDALQRNASPTTFAWLEDIVCTGGDDSRLELVAPSDMTELWVNQNFASLLNREITLAAGRQMTFVLRAPTKEERAAVAAAEAARPVRPEVPAGGRSGAGGGGAVLTIPAPETPSLNSINSNNTFANFVRGPENEMALAAALNVAKEPGKKYNPLFIYGATGLGKTHLLHAIALAVLENSPRSRILYISCEAFTNHYIRTVAEGSWSEFRRHYRQNDVLLLDDVHFLAGKERTQEEFFHTFNDLHNDRRQIVLTSDRPPEEMRELEERLVTRLKWGMVADIQPPSLETRTVILHKKAASLGFALPAAVAAFLAERITVNVRSLEGAVQRLKLWLDTTGADPAALTPDVAGRVLAPLLTEAARSQLDSSTIQRHVADYYRITPAEIIGRKRTADIAFARQVAMFLCVRLTEMSLKAIGDSFGRDHGTVIHARKTVENRCETDERVKQTVSFLTEKITRLRA